MDNSRSGLRELQIAQGLTAVRWVAIPILLTFGVIATRLWGMKFPIGPIYLIACLWALVNVYFTIHISILSRQLYLRHGIPALKRFLLTIIGQITSNIKIRGIWAFFTLPKIVFKVITVFYLMTIEALKGIRFNPLALDKIMHSQIIMDTLTLILFIRFTGASESPLVGLLGIPIIVAGAVMGFFTGGVYAVATSLAYLILCLLVNFKIISHMKFYGPQFGDLSQSLGWTISSFTMLLVSLLGTAYMANHLTAVFKERIFFLNHLLDKNRRDSNAQAIISENTSSSWFILDSEGVILRYKLGKTDIFPNKLNSKNIFEVVPSFKQHGLGYILQSVITSGKPKDIGRLKIQSTDGIIHTVCCRLLPMVNEEKKIFTLLIVEDITELVFLKEQVNKFKEELEVTKRELEKVTFDAKEANVNLVKALKQANDRSVEITQLMTKLNELEVEKNYSNEQLSAVLNELASVKASNDTLAAELKYKQMILEEIIELLKNCTHLDHLAAMIERRSKALFKLDNACLHIFQSSPSTSKVAEILDTRRASPKLLDLPRKNPKVLEPVVNDGKPVVIMAEVHPEKAASLSISSGNLRRLIAYIPIRHENEVLGMMMMDRYGPEENTEKLIEMIVYYLSHTAFALKNAIAAKNWENQKCILEKTIVQLESNISGLLQLIKANPIENGFSEFLTALKNLTGASDLKIFHFQGDGSIQTLSIEGSLPQDNIQAIETEIIKALQNNPSHKISVKENQDGRSIMGYPLKSGNQLIGVLQIVFDESTTAECSLVDIIAQLASEHLALLTLREEKEVWENFYQENLKA